MKKMITALQIILRHLINNFSNYCLTLGIILINYYILITYGLPNMLLSIGIISIITSIVIELNKDDKSKNRRF